MEAEAARRRLFEDLGKHGQSLVLCAHAHPRGFSRDPVFPDRFVHPGESGATAGRLRTLNAILASGLKRIEAQRPDTLSAARVDVRVHGGWSTFSSGPNSVRVAKSTDDRMRRAHKTTGTNNKDTYARDAFLALYRYQTLGMLGGMSASVPPTIYRKLLAVEPRAVECFASLFNHTTDGYYGLFPDVEAPFGCRGSFFRLQKPLPLMLCNPPFERCVMNAFIDKVTSLLDRGPGAALVVLPAFDVKDRRTLNSSGKCKGRYPVDYETDVRTADLKGSKHAIWHGLYCKERFPYVDLATGKTVRYTSTFVVMLSSYKTAARRQKLVDAVRSVMPSPDIMASDRG